jgi:hypothetical protein
VIILDELPFEHGVFQINAGEMNAEGLKYAYKKLVSFLNFEDQPHAGLTCIVSPQWMYVAPLHQAYHKEKHLDQVKNKELEDGVPVYLDGFAYAGILNLQGIVQQWPATTGIGEDNHTILSAFEKQGKALLVAYEEKDEDEE